MPMFGLLRMWFAGLLAVALWVGVGFLVREWAKRLPDPRPPAEPRVVQTDPPQPPPRLPLRRSGSGSPRGGPGSTR